MEVILKEDVPSLGKAGQIVNVSPGHGRNFLLPYKKAVPATKENLKRLNQEQQAIENQRARKKQTSEELGEKLKAVKVVLEKQSGEEDKIFGSISTRDIEASLKAQGLSIDKKSILIKDPIRKLGEHTVHIHLHAEVVVPVTVIVTKK